MATNAQRVFDLTMALMDEISDTARVENMASNNHLNEADTREYKNRTLFILNTLRGELYPYSDTYELGEPGKRPIVGIIENFTDDIGLDDYICQTVMPYGLAAHLLLDENPSAASYFNGRYQELVALLSRGIPQGSEDIIDLYGGIEYGEFSHW